MLDEAAIFLLGARHEARHVHKGDNRNVETVAEADKARRLAGGVNIQHAGQRHRLVGDKADRGALNAAEATENVGAEFRADLEEVAFIGHFLDQLAHVVGRVRVGRDQRVEAVFHALGGIIDGADRRVFAVRSGQEVDQAAHLDQRLDVILERAIDHAGLGRMNGCPAEGFVGDFLVRHGLHHVRAGDVHVRRVLHHEDEVGQRRRIDVAAGARAHDDGDLGDHAGGEDVLHEDVGIAGEAVDAFLDARAARIEDADHWRAIHHGGLLDLHNLGGMGFRQGAAEDGEVFREDIDEAAIDGALAGDNAVAGDLLLIHAEIGALMLNEHVVFFEAAFIQQHFDTLPRAELAFGVLAFDSCSATALTGLFAFGFQRFDHVLHGALPAFCFCLLPRDYTAAQQRQVRR